MSKEDINEVKTAVDSLRETVEKYGTDSAEFKAMSDKTNTVLEENETKHQAIVADLADVRKKELEGSERIDALELVVANHKSGANGPTFRDTDEYKALNLYVKHGMEIDNDQKGILVAHNKTMRMDDDTAGGYLTTTEMDTQIIKKITEMSPVRQVARVRTVSKKTLEIPVRNTIPTASYEGETASGDDSASTYANEQLTTFRLTTTVPFTMDLLGDSNFDLMNEINGDVSEAFAFTEGNKFVLGTGAKQPEGFLVNPDIVAGARVTSGSGTIDGDDLLLLTGDLKVGYAPMYGFNRQTLAFLRTLKGSDGHYIWQAGLAPNQPNTIAGEPYIVMQDMPSIAVGTLPVIFGDFARGYTITDRTGMMVIRDDFSKKRQAIVEMTFHRWNTGQVVLSEAFKALEIKA